MEKKEKDAAIVTAAATLAKVVPSPLTGAILVGAIATKGKGALKKVEDKAFEYYDRKEKIDQEHLSKKTTTIEVSIDPETGLPRVRTSQTKEYK